MELTLAETCLLVSLSLELTAYSYLLNRLSSLTLILLLRFSALSSIVELVF